jgi:hypothetical protein
MFRIGGRHEVETQSKARERLRHSIQYRTLIAIQSGKILALHIFDMALALDLL